MVVYLDDLRNPPSNYTSDKFVYIARSVNIAKSIIEDCESKGIQIDFIDCDHDMGDYYNDGGDGIKLLDWLVERNTFYSIKLHTANPVGRDNMQRMINRFWR